jgi:G3E family GTPase
VLTGFLGSGKTTLLNRMLRSPTWTNTAVIVNELGEISLDHLLIETSSDNVKVLHSGCLCCALQGDLRETLADLFVRRVGRKIPSFERVVIETTGLADPGPVANALVCDALLRAEYRFSVIATTVDAMQAEAQIEHYTDARRQIALADLLIITKTDLAIAERVTELRRHLSELNSIAPLVLSIHGELDPEVLFAESARHQPFASAGAFGGGAEGYSGLGLSRHTTATAQSFLIEHPVYWSGIGAWVAFAAEHFGDRLLRVKGIFTVADDDSSVAIHGIGRFFHPPERLGKRASEDRASRLVCIGRGLSQEELEGSLKLLRLPRGAERPYSLADL